MGPLDVSRFGAPVTEPALVAGLSVASTLFLTASIAMPGLMLIVSRMRGHRFGRPVLPVLTSRLSLALYPTLSAWDNLLFFGRIYGLRGRRLKERVEAALDAVGLRDRAKDAVETFSGGMKRRVNLAAALVHEPKILFLDEPTVGVDPQSRNHIFETVERLSGQGTTVLYTTHYMEEAERLCDRVAIMDQGRILALDTPKDLVATLGGGVIEIGLREVVDGVLDRMKAIPQVTSAQLTDRTLSLRARGASAALVSVINALNDSGAVVNSLKILEPSLETVFLHLTGKQLRD